MSTFFHIEEILDREGVFVSTIVGTSMYPMLRSRKDTIIVRPVAGRLHKYDVPLYKRENMYILHRIVAVRPDGYVICGDHCMHREYDITDQDILGVLTAFYRGNRLINMSNPLYWIYCRVWVALFPLRRLRMRVYCELIRCFRRFI